MDEHWNHTFPWLALREGRIRVSPNFYNTDEEIDELLARIP